MPGRKPRPKPLAYSRALIAKEKWAVLRRTALRIQELTGETPSNNPPTVVDQINNWHSCLSTFCFCMLLLVLNLLLWQWLYYNKAKLTKCQNLGAASSNPVQTRQDTMDVDCVLGM
jgi:hypothetical protein